MSLPSVPRNFFCPYNLQSTDAFLNWGNKVLKIEGVSFFPAITTALQPCLDLLLLPLLFSSSQPLCDYQQPLEDDFSLLMQTVCFASRGSLQSVWRILRPLALQLTSGDLVPLCGRSAMMERPHSKGRNLQRFEAQIQWQTLQSWYHFLPD